MQTPGEIKNGDVPAPLRPRQDTLPFFEGLIDAESDAEIDAESEVAAENADTGACKGADTGIVVQGFSPGQQGLAGARVRAIVTPRSGSADSTPALRPRTSARSRRGKRLQGDGQPEMVGLTANGPTRATTINGGPDPLGDARRLARQLRSGNMAATEKRVAVQTLCQQLIVSLQSASTDRSPDPWRH